MPGEPVKAAKRHGNGAGDAMPEASLLTVCAVAGLSVFVVLSFLAGVIHLLNLLLPPRSEPAGGVDAVLVAAVTQAVQAARPGTRVTRIEESR